MAQPDRLTTLHDRRLDIRGEEDQWAEGAQIGVAGTVGVQPAHLPGQVDARLGVFDVSVAQAGDRGPIGSPARVRPPLHSQASCALPGA